MSRPEWDPILGAAYGNESDEIGRLVSEEGVDPGHTNRVGQSALHIASLWGNVESVNVLLSLGASFEAHNTLTGATPLHSIVASSKKPLSRRVQCARLLLEAGANPTITDDSGMTPLECLQDDIEDGMIDGDDENMQELLKLLQSVGASRSPLFSLIDDEDAGGVDIMITDHWDSCSCEFERKTGYYPLHYAVDKLLASCEGDTKDGRSENLLSIIRSFLEAGADPNAEPEKKTRREEEMSNEDGSDHLLHRTCVALYDSYSSSWSGTAFERCLEQVASLLVQYGAIPSQPTCLMLHDACRRGKLSMATFLVETVGIDPNTIGRQGLTPLHFASRSGQVDIVQWLLAYEPRAGVSGSKVDPSLKDDRGKTAIEAARVNNRAAVVSLLEGLGSKEKQ